MGVTADYRKISHRKKSLHQARGYEGLACDECGEFTLLRNGNVLKCDTCGHVIEEPDHQSEHEIVRYPGETTKN